MPLTKTIPRHTLFSWSTNFDVDRDGKIVYVHYHTETDSYKIQLNAATVIIAKDLIVQIKAWMNQSDTWTGTVVEHQQLQDVAVASKTEKQWVVVP